MKIAMIGNGFQAMIDDTEFSLLALPEKEELEKIYQKYMNKIVEGKPFRIDGDNGSVLIYWPQPGDHLIIMTEPQYAKLQAQARFAVNQPGRRGH